jgi:hypothetical protein
VRDAFTYMDGFHYDAGYYIGSVHFSRWGYKNDGYRPFQWVASSSINSLAEDLGLVKVSQYRNIPFVVDDFGNLRVGGHLRYYEERWVYPEEWDECKQREEEEADER